MATHPSYWVILAYLDGAVVGFSALYVFDEPPFALLEYMAVDEAVRGRGLGSMLFRESTRVSIQQEQRTPVVLEVDSDREESPDRETRLQRLKFYRRLGCLRVDGLDYILPLETGEKPPLIDFLVWREDDRNHIEKAIVEEYLRQIYVDVYGCGSDDKRIAKMFFSVSEMPSLI